MSEQIKVVVFSLGEEEYAVEVEQVRTIERIQPFTRVPNTPHFTKGVIHVQGVVTPVIDLRGRFGLEEKEYTERQRIIVVKQENVQVGMVVDSAKEIMDIDVNSIEDPPEIVGGIEARYLRGIARIGDGRLLVLINLDAVLNREELLQLENMG